MKLDKKKVHLHGNLDGGLSWFIALASFMTQFVVMGIHNVFGLLYIDLLEEFGKSKAATGKSFLFKTQKWPEVRIMSTTLKIYSLLLTYTHTYLPFAMKLKKHIQSGCL